MPKSSEVYDYITGEQEIGCWCRDDNNNYKIAGIKVYQWHEQLQKQLKLNMLSYIESGSFLSELAFDRAFSLASEPDLNFVIDLFIALDSVCNLARSLDLARALNFAIDIDLTQVSNLARNIEMGRDFVNDLIRRDLARDRKLAREVTRNLANARNLANNLAYSLANARELVRNLANARELVRNLADARTVLNDHAHTQNPVVFGDYLLGVYSCLALLIAFYRQAFEKRSFIKQANHNQDSDDMKVQQYINFQHEAGQLYCHIASIELRQKGTMPAWEGIRIVREREF